MPPELVDALLCERYGSLLEPGGILDQPVKRMTRMQAAKGVYDAFRAYRTKTVNDVEFGKRNPETLDLVMDIEMTILRPELFGNPPIED